MTPQHTPGPWSQDRFGTILGPDGRQIEATGLALICGYRDKSDPAFANARLIASAPALHEALVACQAWFESTGHVPGLSEQIEAALAPTTEV